MMKKIVRVFLALLLLGSVAGYGASGLAPYPSLDEVWAQVRAMPEHDPDRAELFTAGQSAAGRDLLGVRIHEGDGRSRPAALIAATIHGDEYIGAQAALAAAVMLLQADEPAAREALERMDVYVLPVLNPDGYTASWDSGGNLPPKQTRTNGHGVDLNRNFGKPKVRIPLPLGYSGSRNPDSTRYTGPAPFSEPESQAVQELARTRHFFAAVDFHCSGGIIIPVLEDDPWTQKGLRQAAQAYQQAQADRYWISMFPWWLPIYQGAMEEGLYRETGALAILIELGKSKDMEGPAKGTNHFFKFNPSDPAVIERVAQDNARAALRALISAYDYSQGQTQPRPAEVE